MTVIYSNTIGSENKHSAYRYLKLSANRYLILNIYFLVRYGRVRSKYQDFSDCGSLLINKLFSVLYRIAKLVSPFKKSMGDILTSFFLTMWSFLHFFSDLMA